MLCKQSKLEYKYHPKRAVAKNSNPGQIHSTDVAIVLKSLLGGGFISKVLYEYKTAIHPSSSLHRSQRPDGTIPTMLLCPQI